MGKILELERECYVCFDRFRPIVTNGDFRCPICKWIDEQQEIRDRQEWEKENAAFMKDGD